MQEKDYARQHSYKRRLSQLRKAENDLELRIERLYKECVGHTPTQVQCAFLNTSDLYIYLEGTHSPSEIFLEEWGSSDLVSRMRQAINQIIKEKINTAIQSDLSVRVHNVKLLKPERSEQLNVLVSFQM